MIMIINEKKGWAGYHLKTVDYVEHLRLRILAAEMGVHPNDLIVTGSSSIYQTTQFTNSSTKYHNHYFLCRVGAYFGACSHTQEQLPPDIATQYSGSTVKNMLEDERLPIQIAAMDAYLGVSFSHPTHCNEVVRIAAGDPLYRAKLRDDLIARLATIQKYQKIALIGVVNPLVEAIEQRGAICLPCDFQLEQTQSGLRVEKDMEKVLASADSVICTGMTLSNGTFSRILSVVKERRIPLTVYAQTGSAIVAQFIGKGVTRLVAEPFPFTQFSANATEVYCYKADSET